MTLSYQQKVTVPAPAPVQITPVGPPSSASTTNNPVPVLPPGGSSVVPVNSATSATSPLALAKPSAVEKGGASPSPATTMSSPQQQRGNSKVSSASPDKKTEGIVPPLKLAINSGVGSASSAPVTGKSPVKPVTPLATVTTPSKTSMKLATVTTPRIKQTARKNQTALQRSPTNLASISPPKQPPTAAAPVATTAIVEKATPVTTTTPVKSTTAIANTTPVKQNQSAEKVAAKSPPVVIEKSAPPPQQPVAPVAPPAVPVTAAAAVVNTPTTPQQRKPREPKAPAGSAKVATTPSSIQDEAGGSAKSKRNRIRTVPYQIPTPEITLAQKLSIAESPLRAGGVASGSGAVRANSRGGGSSDSSGSEDKLTLFYKNEFVAVRNAEDGFFLCQVLQNVYKSSPKIRIRWLSETKKSRMYEADFYDVTDLECILTNVELEKEKGAYELPKEEQTRIENILKKAMGLLEVNEITEDNPDGCKCY